MNWDAIGAVAELLGAIGVIASLIYLGVQLRRSTRATQAGSYQQFDDSLQATLMEGVTVPALDRVARSGMADFDQLNEEDAFRFNFWMGSLIRRYDAAYYQYRSGMLDEGRWQMLRVDLANWLANPGVKQWWRTQMTNTNPEFVALVEEILAEEAASP